MRTTDSSRPIRSRANAPGDPHRSPGRLWVLRLSAVAIAVLASIVLLETLLRILPTNEGPRRAPVNDADPIARLEPNRTSTWSRDWNFSIVNEVRVNNDGFVSGFDYDADGSGSLIAVIGDSTVEAVMVPFRQTCAGRLAETLAPDSRVYSFGLSGAPLSQYLAWARYIRDKFRPDGLVIVVFENDYDESMMSYARYPGFHYFVEDSGGDRLVLQRIDFEPSLLHRYLGTTAIYGYLSENLVLKVRMIYMRHRLAGEEVPSPLMRADDPIRVADSKRAVDAFLERLPGFSGLDPDRIVFVVDGIRPPLYDREELRASDGSLVDVMRRYFLAAARRQGYETLDMQPVFIAHHREHRRRFEWPQDRHWNPLGHEMCWEAVMQSSTMSKTFPRISEIRAGAAGDTP